MNTSNESGRSRLGVMSVLGILFLCGAMVYAFSLMEPVAAQPLEGEVVVTEAGQIVELFALGYSYPQVWPWEPAEFEPVTVVWTDPQNLPKELAGFQDSLSELVCDVALWPLWVVLHPQTGEVAIRYPYSDKEMVRLPVPKGFPAGEIHRALLRETQLLTGMSPLRSWSELVAAGESHFAPPQITLHAWLGDYRDAPRYWSNQIAWAEAEAAAKWTDPPVFGEVAVESGTGGGGGMMLLMGGGGCAITNDADPFVVVDISPDSNGWVTVTWESCPDHLYQPLTSEDLVQGEWTVRDTLVGQDGFTSWTDTNAPVFEARFYRILRLSGTGDWDGDFWSDSSELNAGYDPMVATDHPAYGFAINGGVDVVSGTQLEVSLLTGIVAQSVIVSESITFEPCVTNTFAESFSYSLVNTNDGLHTVFLRLLNSTGSPSPIFGRSVVLDTAGPTLAITAPTNGVVTGRRRLTVEGFAADANDAHTANDTGKALLVTVNDSFINARDTNGVWWSGAHDLVPGTNTFTVVAADRAGFAVTNAVFVIYDPTLATNVPAFTADMTNTVVTVASNTTVFAIAGGIDDDNAIVRIDLLDPVDNTITNASVTAAVQGTNWWADVPVLSGSNLVVITAQNASAPPVTNSFLSVHSTNTFLVITSPAAYAAANSNAVLVTGMASLNFDAAITVNGQAASTTTGAEGVSFSFTLPITNIGANVIDIEAHGTDGSYARSRQIVYGYEFLALHQDEAFPWGHVDANCWFAHHYPNQHPYAGTFVGEWDWIAPATNYTGYLHDETYSYSQSLLRTSTNPYDSEFYPQSLDIDDSGWSHSEWYKNAVHLDASRSDSPFFDCPFSGNCNFQNPPYGEGESAYCCIDTTERQAETGLSRHQVTFIKRWPTDEEQTVVLHFKSFYYFPGSEGVQAERVTLWGQPGFVYSTSPWTVGFVVKLRTNTPYTIRDTDFAVPMFNYTGEYNHPNSQSTFTYHESGQMLGYSTFGNNLIRLHSVFAVNRKASFEFGKTDLGDPCDSQSKAPALVILFNKVVNKSFEVQPFDVYLEIVPGVTPAAWTKHSGPDSGTLSDAGKPTAKFSTPAKGGLYQFDLACLDKVTRTQLLLPLAGADIATWLDAEMKAIPAWAAQHKAAVLAANRNSVPFVTRYDVYRVWTSISGSFFDYTFRPVDSQGQTPCATFNHDGTYPYVTINGTVAHGSKVNTMLWAEFGRAWGYSVDELRLGAHLNQIGRDRLLDGESSQNAILLGSGFYSYVIADPNANLKDLLTQQQVLRLRQSDDELKEEILWPGDPADLDESDLSRPELPTTP